jgi:hypothetical protein
MQTLGLSDSTPRTGSRLKSLFWPSIQTGSDVDYLGAQGYWVCALVAVFSLAFSAIAGHAIVGALVCLFYYLGGVGVRERSRYAAAAVLVMYVADMLVSGVGVVRVILAALLLSNLRATWIASHWKPDSDEAIHHALGRHGKTSLPTSCRCGFGPKCGFCTTCYPLAFWRLLPLGWR